MRKFLIFSLLFLLFSSLAQAAEVSGKVDRFLYGPDGKPDGLLLQNRAVLKFSPLAHVNTDQAKKGDIVFAQGSEILKSPNLVLDRVIVKRGSTIVADESNREAEVPDLESAVPQSQTINYKATYDTSSLFAVSARENGEIDRLILSDGNVIRIPPEGFVPANQLKRGIRLYVQGVAATPTGAAQFSPRFMDAMNVEGPNQRPLLRVKGPGQWLSQEANIKQLLLTPDGQADGALLSDNSAIRFAPIPAYQVADLKSGVAIRVAGREVNRQMHVGLLYLTDQEKVLDFAQLRNQERHAGAAGQAAIQPTTALAPLTESSTVVAVLRDPVGAVDAIVLANGAVVRAGKLNLKDLDPGDRISVSGFGGEYVEGTALDADKLTRLG